jgi:peptide methionine sulfoxide reductase msrA/msrB
MAKTETALLAAGCFWGVQAYFDQVPGVVKTEVGYSGGHVKNPTYEQVCMHNTGHAETTKIDFDAEQISYADILRQFFRMHDPTQVGGQGPDMGDNYRSAIFYLSDQQKKTAEEINWRLPRCLRATGEAWLKARTYRPKRILGFVMTCLTTQ